MGDTAANYFCPSLESLSKLLKLSPTIAGVTLLSLGNGASDVFASIVSFTSSGNGDVGLNGVLGGALFVSSSVVGIISIVISPREISVDKLSFIRDVLFFLFTLSSLLLIVFIGEITFWGALCFVSIYLVYVGMVSASHFLTRKEEEKNPNPVTEPVIPVISKSFYSVSNDDLGELGIPLLGYVDHDEKPIPVGEISSVDQNQPSFLNLDPITSFYLGKLLVLLELPLYLPRRLTIPVISEDRWCKPFAVISVTLAPILVAELYNSQIEKNMGTKSSLVIYLIAGLIGIIFGNLALVTTKKSNPPKNCLLPWYLGGFLMSVTWTYITAEELVSLLVSLGIIFGINPSVLGLTVLAWGNSLGDLIANVTMAMNGGADGVQIAISGCYAGPMFNTLMGLGISFVLSSLYEYPDAYVIPGDSTLYETLGFLMGVLLWALVILPRKKMKLDRFLGFGLLAIYSCFLFLRLARAVGVLRLHGDSFSASLKWRPSSSSYF